VYRAALDHVDDLCRKGETVLVCTRELGCLRGLFALRRRHPSRLRVLHECHDYYMSIRHLPKRDAAALRRLCAERMLLPRVDGLVCLTEYQRALYQQHLPQQPAIALPLGTLPQPVDAGQLEQRRQARSVAYIGHLHDYKGLEALFALARALQAHGVTLHAFGGGPTQIESLRERVRAAGLEVTLRLTAFVPPRELHARLASTVSIGLVPLQDTYYNRYLTCPVKALDFMSHGLPVIGTDLPSVRALLGDAGCYADFDGEPTAGMIAELLADPARYAAQSGRIRARADMLTWQRRAMALSAFAAALFAQRR
jgi:glycosyltransferase involved in cell wall biosynthesis